MYLIASLEKCLLKPFVFSFFLWLFETQFHWVAQARLELAIPGPNPLTGSQACVTMSSFL